MYSWQPESNITHTHHTNQKKKYNWKVIWTSLGFVDERTSYEKWAKLASMFLLFYMLKFAIDTWILLFIVRLACVDPFCVSCVNCWISFSFGFLSSPVTSNQQSFHPCSANKYAIRCISTSSSRSIAKLLNRSKIIIHMIFRKNRTSLNLNAFRYRNISTESYFLQSFTFSFRIFVYLFELRTRIEITTTTYPDGHISLLQPLSVIQTIIWRTTYRNYINTNSKWLNRACMRFTVSHHRAFFHLFFFQKFTNFSSLVEHLSNIFSWEESHSRTTCLACNTLASLPIRNSRLLISHLYGNHILHIAYIYFTQLCFVFFVFRFFKRLLLTHCTMHSNIAHG